MITVRMMMAGVLVTAACSAPPTGAPPAPAEASVRPVNSMPSVVSQSPPRELGGIGRNQAFQTPNSLPPGAATGVTR